MKLKHYFRKTYFLNFIITLALFFSSHYSSGTNKIVCFSIGSLWLIITLIQAYNVAYYKGRADEDNGNRYQNSKRWAILLPLFLMASCDNSKAHFDNAVKDNIVTIEIDSCQYLYYHNNNDGKVGFTHKGNCAFCKERSATNGK